MLRWDESDANRSSEYIDMIIGMEMKKSLDRFLERILHSSIASPAAKSLAASIDLAGRFALCDDYESTW